MKKEINPNSNLPNNMNIEAINRTVNQIILEIVPVATNANGKLPEEMAHHAVSALKAAYDLKAALAEIQRLTPFKVG